MKWIEDYLTKWHNKAHSNDDLIKLVKANREIAELKEKNKQLELQLEIKQMTDFLQTGRI
jgi:hypothetical protein